MSGIIKSAIVKGVFISVAFILASMDVAAQKRNPLWDTQNEFRKEGYGLRGPVYTVAIKRMRPVIELGLVVRTNVTLLDSLVFDDKGNIAKRYKGKEERPFHFVWSSEQRYQISDNAVEIILSNYGEGKSVEYTYDGSGRISEVRYFENGELTSRRAFEYTAAGYSSVYYHDRNEKEVYGKKGNEFAEVDHGGTPTVGTLNKNGQPVKATEDLSFLGKATTYYTYNQHGDLVKMQIKAAIGDKMVGTRQRGDVYQYEYVYDDHGNWIEKRTYKNGKLESDYERREIVYKSPEGILAESEAEQESTRLFEQELHRKGVEFADAFVNKQKQNIANSLETRPDGNALRSREHTPLIGFSVVDDVYTFVFSDGDTIRDVRFTIRQPGRGGDMISSDLRIALVSEYEPQGLGLRWYVVRYKDIGFDFDPNDSTDWVQVYRSRYPLANDISEKEIHAVWQQELDRQWYQYKNRMEHSGYYPECINEIVDPYENGFVSPSIADKEEEARLVERNRSYKAEQERRMDEEKAEQQRRELCHIALNACRFNKKGKPDSDRLKKFRVDESGYYFKTKDNTEYSNVIFDKIYEGNVFLSSDQTLALVVVTTYDSLYIFLVELDGGQVKSVNHISPKEAVNFPFPQL